ncbi:MAG TPA: glycosyltransferase family 2 protein [Chthonomonadales bacterium]|nr:glycosyltransferase family 2 protein [Chthonomonadales bacterium]
MTEAAAPSCVSVVIVSYNTREQLRRCLASIEPEHEVVVVDNASSDGSAEMVERDFPCSRLLRNASNRGFGAANNQGLAVCTRPLALLLNSDAWATPGAIGRLAGVFGAWPHAPVAAAGGRLLHPDGRLQLSSANALTLWAVVCEQLLVERAFPRSRWLAPYWNSHRIEGVAAVEQVMGACLMLRPDARFDERFFLYCEDTELCHRLRAEGDILYVPDAVFYHELGASSAADRWRSVAHYNRSKELYFRIHRGPAAEVACRALDRLGALARLVGWAALAWRGAGARAQVALFWRVLTAPAAGPPPPSS